MDAAGIEAVFSELDGKDKHLPTKFALFLRCGWVRYPFVSSCFHRNSTRRSSFSCTNPTKLGIRNPNSDTLEVPFHLKLEGQSGRLRVELDPSGDGIGLRPDKIPGHYAS
eukprot:1361188-Amorphochlora_amoeboformis.AAC.2